MRRIIGYIKDGKYIRCDVVKKGKGVGDAEHVGGAFDKEKGYWESLGDEEDRDTHIETKAQLRKVCEKKGLRSKYLEDSM